MPSQHSELCLNKEQGEQGKWSLDTSPCRASTSRGLSHSSGDFDVSEPISLSTVCSCDSNSSYCQEHYEIPCLIRSTSQIRRSKWNIFRKTLNFFNKKRKFKHEDKHKIDQNEKENAKTEKRKDDKWMTNCLVLEQYNSKKFCVCWFFWNIIFIISPRWICV